MKPHITKISENGLKTLTGFEGYSSRPYFDSGDVATIGHGTIRYPDGRRVTMQDKWITPMLARAYMIHDLVHFESGVDGLTVDTLSQNQFDALVCFAYNVGTNALKGSTLLKKVNRNPDDALIAEEFTKWIFAAGKKIKGLLTRRNKESQLYFLKA